jgi:hypothetical protein
MGSCSSINCEKSEIKLRFKKSIFAPVENRKSNRITAPANLFLFRKNYEFEGSILTFARQ